MKLNLTAMPDAAILLLLAAVGALGSALIMQYVFDIAPCQLCLWQRVPFAVIAALCLAMLALRSPSATRWLFMGCASAALVNAGLAVFHSGVERHWWEFHSACTGSLLSRTGSIDDLRRELLEKPVVRCDQISWSVWGLSMANLNVAFSLVLAFFAARCLKASR